jgi:hypothetical protein
VLTSEAMLNLAAELTDATAAGDAGSLAAIAWQLYGEAGENLAEIGRLRAAVHAAWNQPAQRPSTSIRYRLSRTAGAGATAGPGDCRQPAAGATTNRV